MVNKPKSNVEQFVDAYLSKFDKVNKLRGERKYIIKAIKIIEFFLDSPCCDDPDATISFSRLNNQMTNFIKANLIKEIFDRRKFRKSLERTLKQLRAVIYDPCCFEFVPFNIEDLDDFGESGIITFIGQDGQGTFSIPVPFSDFPEGITIPVTGSYIMKFDAADGPNGTDVVFNLEDSDNNVISTMTIVDPGITISSSVFPAQSGMTLFFVTD